MGDIAPVQDKRVGERIDHLRKQTLEETFAELLETQQYVSSPRRSDLTDRQEMDTLLSTRTALKVLQQFEELPKEQALEKLPRFCEVAVKKYEALLDHIVARRADRSLPSPGIGAADCMVCMSLLLAARLRENKLLIHQIDRVQSISDAFDEKIGNDILRNFATLDDDCILTVLMYALKEQEPNGEIDIPDTVKQRVIPFYRWDADLTHSDFMVRHGGRSPSPDDLVERFTVYVFPLRFDDQQKKAVIDTLKERLSK